MVHDGGMPATTISAYLAAAAAIPESPMPWWMCIAIGALGWGIDYSAVGPNSLRDRVAAVLYLASALGWFQRLGLAAWEEELLAQLSHDWRIACAMPGAVVMFLWCCAMVPALPHFGRLGAISYRKSAGTPGAAPAGKVHAITAVKSGEKINTYLLYWTIAFAASLPTLMPEGVFTKIVAWITTLVIATGLGVGIWIGNRMGWN